MRNPPWDHSLIAGEEAEAVLLSNKKDHPLQKAHLLARDAMLSQLQWNQETAGGPEAQIFGSVQVLEDSQTSCWQEAPGFYQNGQISAR